LKVWEPSILLREPAVVVTVPIVGTGSPKAKLLLPVIDFTQAALVALPKAALVP
jgi:hypothetical protein